MTFLLTCPVCGRRDLGEFAYGGPERGPAPDETAARAGSASPHAAEAHARWAQFRLNLPEAREEWWLHRDGCGVWFRTRRNPATNREEPGEASQ